MAKSSLGESKWEVVRSNPAKDSIETTTDSLPVNSSVLSRRPAGSRNSARLFLMRVRIPIPPTVLRRVRSSSSFGSY